jgi:formylglycine-generating enzyme required for sulfatase activity
MKEIIVILLCLVLLANVNGQNTSNELKPKGMEYVPAGSFQMKTIINSEPKVVNTTVEAFWMSNEITNGEYREFVDWAKKNQNGKLYQVKYSKEVVSDPKKWIMKDTVILKINPIEVSSFLSEMIDPMCLEKEKKEYKDYFTNQKYNDYPAVGVSFKMAENYCLWKTMTENEKLKEKGLPNGQAYRIPLEAEWDYAAQIKMKNNENTTSIGMIQNVKDGNLNEVGLTHFYDNVSEWVTSNKGESGLIRGGSWKSGSSITYRQTIDPNSKTPFVGFRIVQSFMQSRDYKR